MGQGDNPVVFCGSAYLGFSPIKDTEFIPGESDLDVAVVDMATFQSAWMSLVEATRAFNNLTGFGIFKKPGDVVEKVKTLMIKRGVIHLSYMPISERFDADKSFFDDLSKPYRKIFSRINASFYMSEYEFCWKQDSALQSILRG